MLLHSEADPERLGEHPHLDKYIYIYYMNLVSYVTPDSPHVHILLDESVIYQKNPPPSVFSYGYSRYMKDKETRVLQKINKFGNKNNLLSTIHPYTQSFDARFCRRVDMRDTEVPFMDQDFFIVWEVMMYLFTSVRVNEYTRLVQGDHSGPEKYFLEYIQGKKGGEAIKKKKMAYMDLRTSSSLISGLLTILEKMGDCGKGSVFCICTGPDDLYSAVNVKCVFLVSILFEKMDILSPISGTSIPGNKKTFLVFESKRSVDNELVEKTRKLFVSIQKKINKGFSVLDICGKTGIPDTFVATIREFNTNQYTRKRDDMQILTHFIDNGALNTNAKHIVERKEKNEEAFFSLFN